MLKELSNINVIFASSDINGFFSILEKGKTINLVLLDINMPMANGFDIAEYIREVDPSIKIIFMSAYHDFAVKGYKYYPEDFLIKPLNFVRLKQTLDRLQLAKGKRRKIGVKEAGKLFLVDIPLILFIERKGRKTIIHLENQSKIICNESLNRLEEMLKDENFFRTHQSYLIPFDRIESIEQDNFMKSYNVKLKNCDIPISLSRHKYSHLKLALEHYF
jgi:two-component system, LytTR family, response regulator